MDENNIRILVVDDETSLTEILRVNLETEGYSVDTAQSAEEALRRDLSGYNLVLLDVMMGEMSGFDLARRMKADERTRGVPIIFLTALGTEPDTVKGLSIGADDYMAKPFSIRELLLRVKAVLRRTTTEPASHEAEKLSFEGLVMNLDRKTVSVDGEDVPFTKTEFELLHVLLREAGKVLSRSQLIRQAWPYDVEVTERTVDVNITRIRKKIGRYGHNIATRQGFGYYFDSKHQL